jgi:hypothetical protein
MFKITQKPLTLAEIHQLPLDKMAKKEYNCRLIIKLSAMCVLLFNWPYFADSFRNLRLLPTAFVLSHIMP